MQNFKNYESVKNIDISTFVSNFSGYPLKEEKAKVQDEWQVSTPFIFNQKYINDNIKNLPERYVAHEKNLCIGH
jgi:hypothetical protein